MKAASRRAKVAGVALLALATQAHGAPGVSIDAPSACEGAVRDLGVRLERALGATLAAELDASVTLEENGSGYRVTLVTRDGTATRDAPAAGKKTLVLPTCDEAVDAAVVVLALTYGYGAREPLDDAASPSQPSEPSPPSSWEEASPRASSPAASSSSDAPPPTAATPGRVDRGPPRGGSFRDASTASSRATLTAGADFGTLPTPTLTVAGGFARTFSGFELGAIARYGLPTVNENVDSGESASVRRDFGALELRACYGVGARLHVAACGGGEVGAVRWSQKLNADGVDVDEDVVAPRLSGVLAAVVRHRGGSIHPELELSGVAVALGKETEASRFALRLAAGAAVAF